MLSIVITHHRTPVLLKLCLKSIKDNIGQLEHEVIVTDSESEEGVRELIEDEFPYVKFIYFPENLGYAKIVNRGINSSQGEYILILNADILITEDSVKKLLEYMESNPQAGIVGPRLLTFNGKKQSSCFRFPSWGAIISRRTFLGKMNWGKRKINDFLIDLKGDLPRRVDWLQGSAMLVRKEAIKKVGLLDERFFMYFEDTDWCRRFWQNNYQIIYLPTAQMFHYYYRVSKKWGGLIDIVFNKYTRLHLISASKYFWKYRKA